MTLYFPFNIISINANGYSFANIIFSSLIISVLYDFYTSLCVSLSLSFGKIFNFCSSSKFHSKLLCIFFPKKRGCGVNIQCFFFLVSSIYLILFMFLWSCLVYCLESIDRSISLCAQCLCIVDNYFKVQEEIRKC